MRCNRISNTNTLALDYYEGYLGIPMTQVMAKKAYDRFMKSLDILKDRKIDHPYISYDYKKFWTFEQFIARRKIKLIED